MLNAQTFQQASPANSGELSSEWSRVESRLASPTSFLSQDGCRRNPGDPSSALEHTAPRWYTARGLPTRLLEDEQGAACGFGLEAGGCLCQGCQTDKNQPGKTGSAPQQTPPNTASTV